MAQRIVEQNDGHIWEAHLYMYSKNDKAFEAHFHGCRSVINTWIPKGSAMVYYGLFCLSRFSRVLGIVELNFGCRCNNRC